MRIFFRSVYASALTTLAFILALYFSDSKHRESGVNVGIGVLVGIFSAFSVLIIRALFPRLFGISEPGTFLTILNQNFIKAGFLEELVKFAFVLFFFKSLPFEEFPEEYDGMLYFGAVGGGFFLYIFSRTNYFWQIGETAMTHSVFGSMMLYRSYPGHILLGALAGYFLGKARHSKKKEKKIRYISGGFLIAVFAHGLFNTIAGAGGNFGALIFTIILLWIVYGLRKRLMKSSPFTALELFEKSGLFNRWKILVNWNYEGTLDSYRRLKKEQGWGWTIGLIPVFLSLSILFPILIGGLFTLNQLVVRYIPPIW